MQGDVKPSTAEHTASLGAIRAERDVEDRVPHTILSFVRANTYRGRTVIGRELGH